MRIRRHRNGLKSVIRMILNTVPSSQKYAGKSCRQSSSPDLSDAVDSRLEITWQKKDRQDRKIRDGGSTHDLRKLLQKTVEETYLIKK